MSSDDVDARLRALDERVTRLEQAMAARRLTPEEMRTEAAAYWAGRSSLTSDRTVGPHAAGASDRTEGAATAGESVGVRAERPARSADAAVTNVLGWSGAVALVLAAAYLIRLAIAAGWLTPAVQVGAAALAGSLLIGAGVALRRTHDDYLGLLPAAGVAILFLAVYGAHLLYHLVDARAALIAVAVISTISLALCAMLESTLYALFAAAGSYSAPFLIQGSAGSMTDLAVYFSAWSITFTLFAVARGRRLIYLLALYVALIGFDAVARVQEVEWTLVLAFQTVQFLIFGIGTIAFSIRRKEPLDERAALLHLPALLLFYGLQYAILEAHAPAAAPWVALASLFAVALLYGMARWAMARRSAGGELLLGLYAALVLFHAGYLESVPVSLAPWVVLGLTALALLSRSRWESLGHGLWPLLVAIAAIFVLNLFKLFLGMNVARIPAHAVLGLLYALMLYIGYLLFRSAPKSTQMRAVLLYAGHLTAMSAVVQLVHQSILQSVAWGLLGLACLIWSLGWQDRRVGESSLLLFAATGVKVALFDLSGAAPVIRIGALVVLGATFYAGGLLYRRVSRLQGNDG